MPKSKLLITAETTTAAKNENKNRENLNTAKVSIKTNYCCK